MGQTVVFCSEDSGLQAYRKLKNVLGQQKDTEEEVFAISGKEYLQMGARLMEQGISDYYVMLGGFLYRHQKGAPMLPAKGGSYEYHQKEPEEENILFLQDGRDKRLDCLSLSMRGEGYRTYSIFAENLLEAQGETFSKEAYDGIFEFSSQEELLDFILKSEFDIIHLSRWPGMGVALPLMTSKPVVVDVCHRNVTRQNSIKNAIMDYLEMAFCNGYICANSRESMYLERTYGIPKEQILCWEVDDDRISKKMSDFYGRVKAGKKSFPKGEDGSNLV